MNATTIPSAPKIREPFGDRVFTIVVTLMLLILLALVLMPLIYIVASSFSSPAAVNAGRVSFWPVEFSTEAYRSALSNSEILSGYYNSLIYAVAGTVISVTLTVAIAYPLSRKTFYGRNVIMTLLIFTMLFSGGLIPTYMVVHDLGMLDTRWALLIPGAIGVWQVIIARTFFANTIPDELYEASQLDGAGGLRTLWSVVLPLSKPLLAVLALMYTVYQWNTYFDALVYLKDPDLFPLQIVLRNILLLNTPRTGATDLAQQMHQIQLAYVLRYALIVISSLPVLILYPFVARFFTKGVMVGAVKG
ncbi:putative aldouronate transport system permease protein [Actinoplanes lutulentus]|uniref:Putative aldouronate transport system permease protein n=1 Tax=Actinoplanes lutulentus TaxID=1287878 RepID=A0A327YXQ4_9ACTN|nr:carbohydrate ABC transporter permease [Actinoplanes lutulentus]MBB2948745.1 putative aldouronate transport system permease protein [Actinoplanes lutulentus]RAK26185.1 putative aldouronate transport system permease protein [Actinoplanes lutulentus]